jgi:hypothetical protein
MNTAAARWVFWCAIAAFLAWDWGRSPPINVRLEPPLLAAGSGQASEGGHCSATR